MESNTLQVTCKGFPQKVDTKKTKRIKENFSLLRESETVEFKVVWRDEFMKAISAFATLFVGESATMASECAVLGTQAIYIDNIGRGYTSEQEKLYGLVKNFTESENDQIAAIDYASNLLDNINLKKEAIIKSKSLQAEKINLTDFLLWFIKNYPTSAKIMKENPGYQNRFR
ncbi:MAG: hypothetical protein L3J08_08160 [Flavobacteriaceae bacterium]|nr:hypothetical protein [Flavobacteriaceae bacterium]